MSGGPSWSATARRRCWACEVDGFALFGVEQTPRRTKAVTVKRRGRRVGLPLPAWAAPPPRIATPSPRAGDVLALPHPDWIFHRLTISGPADQVAAFNAAASGA